jgi:hypothetical protein
VHVVLERRRGQEEHVTAEARDGGDGAPGAIPGVSGRPPEAMRLVHHHEVDAGRHCLLRQLRARDQRLQRDDHAAVHVERIEVGAEVARDVRQPVVVEKDEDLVVLPPQLAEPLHGQRLRRDDQGSLDAPGADEAIQDQAGLDRLAQADFVREEPAHGVAPARALRGVELVRKEADAPAEERAEAAGLAQRGQVQRVQADREVLQRVHLARGEPLDEGARAAGRREAVRGHGHERVAGLGQAQAHAARELDHHRALLDLDHEADAHLGVVAMGEPVAEGPGPTGRRHRGSRDHSSKARG